MRRLHILAKGNADVRDSLHALWEDGRPVWNGLNAALRERSAAPPARVAHEVGLRSDLLLALPLALPDRDLPLAAWGGEAQATTRLFDTGHDAVVLSIQPDVMNRAARDRATGRHFYPHSIETWPTEARLRLAATHDAVAPLDPEAAMANLEEVAGRVSAASGAAVLIYNLSPVIAWERLHRYRGIGETLGERIRRFNLALIGLSRRTDVSIVDVEAIAARHGVDRIRHDAVTLTREGCRLVAGEVVRILADRGLLDGAARP